VQENETGTSTQEKNKNKTTTKKKHSKVPKGFAIIATKPLIYDKIVTLERLHTRQGGS